MLLSAANALGVCAYTLTYMSDRYNTVYIGYQLHGWAASLCTMLLPRARQLTRIGERLHFDKCSPTHVPLAFHLHRPKCIFTRRCVFFEQKKWQNVGLLPRWRLGYAAHRNIRERESWVGKWDSEESKGREREMIIIARSWHSVSIGLVLYLHCV